MKTPLLATTAILGAITLSTPVFASHSVYGVLKGGWTDLDDRDIPSGADTTDTTFSLLGGVSFPLARDTFSVGVEGGAVWLGDYGDGNEVDISGIEAAAIGKARIATGTDLFLRAGALRWDAEFDHGSDEDGTDGFWGAGFTYGLDNLKFRGSVDRYSLDVVDVEAYTLGLEYRFN